MNPGKNVKSPGKVLEFCFPISVQSLCMDICSLNAKSVISFSGRGRGDGFMQRGLSYDEGEGGGFGRPRGPRPEGWEEM